MSSARQYLVEHQADFLHQLAELVAIESVSTDGQHGVQLQQAEAWVARALSEVGFKVRTYATAKGADVVFGELLTDPALPTFLLYSHYDVQPVDAPKWTTTQPFQMAVRSGRAWGRGTQDDKGGFVAQLAAI